MIIKTCAFCIKSFQAHQHSRKYCSKKCAYEAKKGTSIPWDKNKKKGKTIKCLICGKEKYYPLSAIKRGGGKFCSNKCMTKSTQGIKRKPITLDHKKKISENHHDVSGDKNPNYRGGITKGRTKWQCKNWKKLLEWKSTVLNRDGKKCKLCGSTKKLEIHHIIPIAETYLTALLPMNGVTLCHECHKKTDSFGGGSRFNKKIEDGIGKTMCLMRTIPHSFQAYDTLGNYSWTENGLLVIFVSDLNDEDKEFLLFIHEYTEATLVKRNGITQKQIDDFDMNIFPKLCDSEKLPDDYEPGDHLQAPYRKEHRAAMLCEHQMASFLGMDDYGVVR